MHWWIQTKNKLIQSMLLTLTPALIGRLLLNRPTLLLQNRWHYKTNSEPTDSFINASCSNSRYVHRALTFQVCFLLTRHQWVWLSLEQKHYLCSNRLTWHISFDSSGISYLLQSPLWLTVILFPGCSWRNPQCRKPGSTWDGCNSWCTNGCKRGTRWYNWCSWRQH